MIKTDLQARLDEAIPAEAVEQRQGGGRQLSYLSGAYVINRLNQVLGQGNWGYDIVELKNVYTGMVNQRSGDVNTASYIAQVTLNAKIVTDTEKDSYRNWSSFTDVGYGDGTDKTNPGKAHELAVKEAITDALKRAAKNLGMSMGLALYFKEGQYVGEESTGEKSTHMDTKSIAAEQAVSVLADTSSTIRDLGSSGTGPSDKILKKQIKSAYAVLSGQKLITKEAFQTDYTQGMKVDDLDGIAVTNIISKLKTNFPQLGL